MHDDATVVDVPRASGPASVDIRPHVRLLHGMRRPANWLQLIRFGLVGGTGFVVNVGVYALCVHALAIDYRSAYVLAWLVAVTNNFVLNRHWTFDARRGQRARFRRSASSWSASWRAGFGFLLLTLLSRAPDWPRCRPRRWPWRPPRR